MDKVFNLSNFEPLERFAVQPDMDRSIVCRERLGGMLNDDDCEGA